MSDYIEILRSFGLQLLVGEFPQGQIGGLALTLILAVTGLACAFPLAVLCGIARTSTVRWVAMPAAAIVHTVRGLPVLMLIFWAYFIVPMLIGTSVSGITTVICALIVYEVAFLGEVIKAGIQAIPKGQVEASRSLGMSYIKTLWDVVLPQALFNMIPSILNQLISLIKNTSLAYIISVNELTYAAYSVNSQLLTKPFQVYFLLAMTYFAICYSLSSLVGIAERRIKTKRQFRST
ncbi:amino ABC transporter, permease, 3-TM region, His/Glu/Gln/Arg/opine family domain protein [Collimonas fungivorans]|uniref:Amino ABC transporter, permease, 3-TM region, His/Glu/Gln/Arg/opine family domain protein n=1 Tax=Collimonas fungivorans TaxID=158899 RepID=A0A127P5Z0_9BURK|nr:amino acid ABC transporter permease [Collimonas fungivorans]AMO93173.1 amino ABC transporter, permease, 3-TM region, His/Glu/Gln/Arg/opine family domain protein [Collimonas fungivorans]